MQAVTITQISRKTIILSATEEVVNKAGRRSELAYQIAKRGAELRRDQEFVMLNGGIAVAGDSTTARVTASLGAFIKTNTDKQTNGTDPSYTTLPNSARTDGNVRTFTETILKNVIQKVWTAGGTPKILMCGPVNKQRVSGFSGIASSRFNIDGGAKPATLIGAVDIYVSDFGNVQVIANRFQRERDAWVLDPEYAKMAVLRPYQQVELAKTGDAEKTPFVQSYRVKLVLCLPIGLPLLCQQVFRIHPNHLFLHILTPFLRCLLLLPGNRCMNPQRKRLKLILPPKLCLPFLLYHKYKHTYFVYFK